MILTSLSPDELERFALFSFDPQVADDAKTELERRGILLDAKERDLAEIDAEIEAAEEALRFAERAVDDADDDLIAARKRRKEREELP